MKPTCHMAFWESYCCLGSLTNGDHMVLAETHTRKMFIELMRLLYKHPSTLNQVLLSGRWCLMESA